MNLLTVEVVRGFSEAPDQTDHRVVWFSIYLGPFSLSFVFGMRDKR